MQGSQRSTQSCAVHAQQFKLLTRGETPIPIGAEAVPVGLPPQAAVLHRQLTWQPPPVCSKPRLPVPQGVPLDTAPFGSPSVVGCLAELDGL